LTGNLATIDQGTGPWRGASAMSENIDNMKLDELTADELDRVVGGQQVSFNFTRIEFKYNAQSAD
jgi:hypothetical protein